MFLKGSVCGLGVGLAMSWDLSAKHPQTAQESVPEQSVVTGKTAAT